MREYYYKIPAKLVESKKHTKAILYGLIKSLCRKKGHCWASNPFLAKKIGLKNSGNISRYIKELEREGWIKTEVKGNQRKIWLTYIHYEKTTKPLQNNVSTPSEISEESITESNLSSNENNLRIYNDMTKGLKDKMDMHKSH
jgi:SOS-response transcriptional repressor LexA